MRASATVRQVTVREVGPRDGLQSVKSVMPTTAKLSWIAAMHAAGVWDMEVASFVRPDLVPQMADADEIVRSVQLVHPGLRATTLVPNLRGARSAVSAGARRLMIPVSASEAHSRSNVHRTVAEQVRAVADIVEWARTLPQPPSIEAGIATAFGCSMQGEVPERDVIALAVELVKVGVATVSLADTLGYATPSKVRQLVRTLRSSMDADRIGGLHLHDTLGAALANVYAALEEGVRAFDSAARGLGGCPFAPGSVGNVATEDLVYLLESEGFDTGIDLPALIAAGGELERALPGERFHSRVSAAGIPRTFRRARQGAA